MTNGSVLQENILSLINERPVKHCIVFYTGLWTWFIHQSENSINDISGISLWLFLYSQTEVEVYAFLLQYIEVVSIDDNKLIVVDYDNIFLIENTTKIVKAAVKNPELKTITIFEVVMEMVMVGNGL